MKTKAEQKPIIALTMGDPGGVGPEVILKALQSYDLDGSSYLLVIGCQAVMDYAAEASGISLRTHPVMTLERSFLREDAINLLDVSDEADQLYEKMKRKKRPTEEVFDIGQVSFLNATLAYAALKVAAYQAACGLIQGVVTAPVNKEAMRLVEPDFSGHTEFLAKVAQAKEYAMLFHGPRFCVTLVTIHVPLKDVARLIRADDVFLKIRLTHEFFEQKLAVKRPRIGVACLNPHGSEFGSEEERLIRPAVQRAKALGMRVDGPFPGDTVFHEAYEGKLDAVIAMYHDQGLAPFKMVAFETGVNVTLGLPYLRTSPDHGTGFEIAYQNKASAASFLSALRLAEKILVGSK
jgi:4-hydroxythreonine-4-phosphate dehydrogenase